MQKFQNMLGASAVYRFFALIARFFSGQWTGSAFLSRFLRGMDADTDAGLLTRCVAVLRSAQLRVFSALKLDKLLRGSMFTHPWVFCCAVLALTAVVPTLLAIPLTTAAFGTLFLRLGADKSFRATPHPAAKFVLLYVAVSAAGTLMSVSLRDSLYGGALQSYFAFFAIAVMYSLQTKREIKAAVYALVLGGFAVSCYGILQYLQGANGASAWLDADMFKGMTRVYSTLGNPNVLAEYLLLTIPFAAACVVLAKNALTRLVALGLLGAMLLCMMLTMARGGWLGLIFAAAVFLVMLDRKFIILGIIGLIALYFLLPDMIIDRLTSIGNLKDGSTSYRVSIWYGTIAMLRDYWFVGIGPGAAAFNKIYPLYSYGAAYTQHSHNLFLQLLCDGGIFLLGAFACLLFSWIRALAASVRNAPDKELNVLRIAAISAVAGFLIQGATDYSFYNYRVALAFWAVTGLGAALSRRQKDA